MKKQVLIITLLLSSLVTAAAFATGGGQEAYEQLANFPPTLQVMPMGMWIVSGRSFGTVFSKPLSISLPHSSFLQQSFIPFSVQNFLSYAHNWKAEHQKKIEAGEVSERSTHIPAEIFHFLGEVEVVFGLWAVVLSGAVVLFYDWHTFINYVSGVNYTEPMFVVVIMTLASSRPILKLSEKFMARIASVFQGTLAAWWLDNHDHRANPRLVYYRACSDDDLGNAARPKILRAQTKQQLEIRHDRPSLCQCFRWWNADPFCCPTGAHGGLSLGLGTSLYDYQLRLEGCARHHGIQHRDLLIFPQRNQSIGKQVQPNPAQTKHSGKIHPQ